MATMKLNGKLVFVDAQEMHQKFPKTFDAPGKEELAAIKVGDCVKIAIRSERFWVLVTELGDGKIIGTVNNDLVFTVEHGLSYLDEVELEPKNVYDIWVFDESEEIPEPEEVEGYKGHTFH